MSDPTFHAISPNDVLALHHRMQQWVHSQVKVSFFWERAEVHRPGRTW